LFQSLFFPTAFAQSNTYALGGLPVSAVTFGQPAALAGLQKGDVIVSVNGTSLRATEHSKAIHVLNAAFSSSSTHVSLDVVRRVVAARISPCPRVTVVRRCHSPIDSDVNTLLGVKSPQLMSIAITGLGGGAFLPATGGTAPSEVQRAKPSAAPSPAVSVVDSTARCMFFAGLLLPVLLLALICFPRPQSISPVSVRFWRIGAAVCSSPALIVVANASCAAAVIALLVQVS
jgi:hypothetical protein